MVLLVLLLVLLLGNLDLIHFFERLLAVLGHQAAGEQKTVNRIVHGKVSRGTEMMWMDRNAKIVACSEIPIVTGCGLRSSM
jgi:hypothetical protein